MGAKASLSKLNPFSKGTEPTDINPQITSVYTSPFEPLGDNVRPDILPPPLIRLGKGPHESIRPLLPYSMKILYELYGSCTELRSTIDKITETSFRNGFEIQPFFYFMCKECGNETLKKPLTDIDSEAEDEDVNKTDKMTCDVCGKKGKMKTPDYKERKILSEWFNRNEWNENGETLEDIAKGFMFHYLVTENSFAIVERNYGFNSKGDIVSRDIQEITTVDTFLMSHIGNLSGRISYNERNERLYVCPVHRQQVIPLKPVNMVKKNGKVVPPRCKFKNCNRETLLAKALAIRYNVPDSGWIIYGEGEIIKTNGYSVRTRGYSLSKIYTLTHKIRALIGLSEIFADRFYIKRPLNSILVVKHNNPESVNNAFKDFEKRKQQNRYASNVLIVPADTADDAIKVINVDDDLRDLELDEIRKSYASDIYDQYGVEPIECFTRDHEIMTEHGFMPIHCVSDKIKVATLNDKNKVEFQYPTKVHNYEYSGKMYEIDTKYISLKVTPDHDLYVRSHANTPYRKIKPSDLPSIIDMKIDFPYSYGRDDKEIVSYLGVEYEANELIKLYCAFYKHGYVENNMVIFPKKSVFGIEAMLENLGLGLDGNFDTVYVINNSNLAHLFKDGGIPEIFLDCSAKQLKPILDTITIGKLNGNKTRIRHRTGSYAMAQTLQEIALKCGHTAIISPDLINEKEYDIYITSRTGTFDSKVNRETNVKEVDYYNPVYCVTVPNGLIYVKRNGKCVWTGNSVEGNSEASTERISLSNSQIEYNQKFLTEKLLDPFCKFLGVNDWHIVPKKVERVDELRDEQVLGARLDNVSKLKQNGFLVEFSGDGDLKHSHKPVEGEEIGNSNSNETSLDDANKPDNSPDTNKPSESGGSQQGSTSSGSNTSNDGRKGPEERSGK